MNRVRHWAVLALIAAAAVTVVESVGATQTALRVIGRKSASGDYAVAIAAGRAKKPRDP